MKEHDSYRFIFISSSTSGHQGKHVSSEQKIDGVVLTDMRILLSLGSKEADKAPARCNDLCGGPAFVISQRRCSVKFTESSPRFSFFAYERKMTISTL